MKIFKNGKIFFQNKLQKLDIVSKDGKIAEIGKNLNFPNAEIINCQGKNIFPALIDIHTHGAVGFDFNTADADGILQILKFYREHGVGSVLPTLLTDSDEKLFRQLTLIAKVKKSKPMIKGMHLEGPFLSAEFCGAMPKRFLKNPDFDLFSQFQKAADGSIKIVTISPELPNAAEFAAKAAKCGVIVSLGHSGADFDLTMKVTKEGAKCFTHTFNAMKLPTQREPNICGAALNSDLFCEVIADGKHVHPEMIKLLLKAKGVEKVIAVSDSMMAAGMPDGDFFLGENKVTVKNGDAFISGTTIRAGSTLTADRAVQNLASMCGLPLETALKTMTENPAKLLGIFDTCGSIEVGKDAEFFIK